MYKTTRGRFTQFAGVLAVVCATFAGHISARAEAPWVPLPGHISAAALNAQRIAPMDNQSVVTLGVTLPLHNQADLDHLLTQLYDPTDPLYGKYLSSVEFANRFCPSMAECAAVWNYLRALGLTITATSTNRTFIEVTGPAATVERAFGVHLFNLRSNDGRYFHAPDADPLVAPQMADKISAIIGLDSSPLWHTNSEQVSPETADALQPWQVGRGPLGGLAPIDITTAYNLNGAKLAGSATKLNGSGQTIGLFELDGYHQTDINGFAQFFNLAPVPTQNVMIDGFAGTAGKNASEVVLDIELAMSIAPGAKKIMVYEAPNSGIGVLDAYNRIAADNIAKQVSTSWGIPENETSIGMIHAEANAFSQMAAQGQTVFAATGDSGAYGDGKHLVVDDPSSQPTVTGVGGTQLFLATDGSHAYKKETAWNHGSVSYGAGGGGVSLFWSKPAYQKGVGFSAADRNTPDISLNADPFSGYSVFFNSAWTIYGGTSCAAPLWVGFTALVNQQRAARGVNPLGFANPALYATAHGSRYSADFHDIADGTTNLYYPTTVGYDNATGWGSFNGANLIPDLAGIPVTQAGAVTITASPSATASMTGVTIAWGTNIPSDSLINYGLSPTSLVSASQDSTPVTSHKFKLTGILAGRIYYYTVTSTANGLSVTSAAKWFASQ